MVRRLPYRHCEGKARSNLFFFSGLLRRSTPRNDGSAQKKIAADRKKTARGGILYQGKCYLVAPYIYVCCVLCAVCCVLCAVCCVLNKFNP